MPKQMDILCSETSLYNAWNIVKEKGAAGGIDGMTIQEFDKEKRKQIPFLVEELKGGTWKPYPYLEIEIAKNKKPDEKRKLGMTAIRDKIVQTAIKAIIEPRYDRIFVGNSYGYRPGKGATKAIRRVLAECKNKRILSLEMDKDGLTTKSQKVWDGITNYYALLLPENDLESFDAYLLMRLQAIITEQADLFPSKTGLQMALNPINFLSKQYQARKKLYIGELIADYIARKNETKLAADIQKNKKLIQQRKKEFRKLAAETSGLLVDKPGTFIGMTSRGLTVMEKGKVIAQHHAENLSHVVVTGKGVSLSSNLINYCMERRIPIDFFDHQGKHIGSIITPKEIQCSLWAAQASADTVLKNTIALSMIDGKAKNQLALLKYFHKYHKNRYPGLLEKMEIMEQCVLDFKSWKKTVNFESQDFTQKLMGHEAQVAIHYWDYIRELISDDSVNFVHREHQGAQDLTNSMLNYGYAILYTRVWQALLAARLNPFESIIHARLEGKPTLAFDMIEIFRSQVVDRIVISLIQKGQNLEIRNGLLSDTTRQLLVKSIMERLARYEKYQGEEMKMENIIVRQAKLLAKAFAREEKFKPYVTKW